MSRVNEQLLPQLKPCDRKRQRLDFATLSRTSLGALLSIRDEAVQQVHKNMQQMIESFLDMPDNEADAPAWCRRAFRRCTIARANTARARWLQLASAYLKLGAARRSPSPSVSSNDAIPSMEPSDDEIWKQAILAPLCFFFEKTGAFLC